MMAKRARPARSRPSNRPVARTLGSRPKRPARSSSAQAVAAQALSPPPPAGPAPEGVVLFERAMRALQRHDYAAGAGHFRAVLNRFPAERPLVERSRVYLVLCERELERRPAAPKTVEERLTAATAALNNADDAAAEKLVRSVLEGAPQQELALYLLAAIEARRGARESALSLLKRAVAVSPEIRAQARHDLDFEALRGLEAFRQLLDAPIGARDGQGQVAARRLRRGRAER